MCEKETTSKSISFTYIYYLGIRGKSVTHTYLHRLPLSHKFNLCTHSFRTMRSSKTITKNFTSYYFNVRSIFVVSYRFSFCSNFLILFPGIFFTTTKFQSDRFVVKFLMICKNLYQFPLSMIKWFYCSKYDTQHKYTHIHIHTYLRL